MQLTIKQFIPVTGHWNKYMRDETQTEVYFPVSALALVEDVGVESCRTGELEWKYIDTLHIESQWNDDAFEDLVYMETIFSVTEPEPE